MRLPGDRRHQQGDRDRLENDPKAHEFVGVGPSEISAAVKGIDAQAERYRDGQNGEGDQNVENRSHMSVHRTMALRTPPLGA